MVILFKPVHSRKLSTFFSISVVPNFKANSLVKDKYFYSLTLQVVHWRTNY